MTKDPYPSTGLRMTETAYSMTLISDNLGSFMTTITPQPFVPRSHQYLPISNIRKIDMFWIECSIMAQPLHWIERFLLTWRDCLVHLGEGEGNLIN